jgi:hypothetical protein
LASLLARWKRRLGWGAPVDETRAWACLVTNLLALPGLGTLMAGRNAGWIQGLLAVGGFVFTTVWFIDFLRTWFRTGALPLQPGPGFAVALLGVGLFAVSWLWALASSVAILRSAKKD